MFTYINENFLHAPSQDLNRDTVKTLIHLTLAQAQEIFLEKQTRDGKQPGLLAKLAAQAQFLYSQAKEALESDSAKGVFDSSWLKYVLVKHLHMTAVAEYYQARADDEKDQHGIALARLKLADTAAKAALAAAKAFPAKPNPASNLGTDTSSILQTITKRQLEMTQELSVTLTRDNEFIYHQTVPAEATVQPVAKLPAAKAIPVSELYQGQDIQRIIGPDIFQKIVPISVTESASMYDEEKAKLVRSEAEKVEQANGEMAASLDYLKLPQSLNVLKNGFDQEVTADSDFERWCRELAGHPPFEPAFEQLQRDKSTILEGLARCTKNLDMEESVCEKMRSKYGAEWTQQPSSRLTSTLRGDVRSYRDTIDEASKSDAQLMATARQYEADFEEMRRAGENDEADVLYQQALMKSSSGTSKGSQEHANLLDEDYEEGGPSVADQIAHVEELLHKLNLVKRERAQVLKDLKDKVHNDDISNVLILNKKAIANQENQLFQAELEKFRSHQNRLIATVHKQSSLLKELTKTFGDLLQDKRVRGDQQRYESIQRSRAVVKGKYKKVFQAHEDMTQGLLRAQTFYSEMRDSVNSLEKNVDAFVNNRRAEGAQLLGQIEQKKSSAASGIASAENERMRKLMEDMSLGSAKATPAQAQQHPLTIPTYPSRDDKISPPLRSPGHPAMNADPRFTIPPRETPAPVIPNGYPAQGFAQQASYSLDATSVTSPVQQPSSFQQGAAAPLSSAYNPMAYPERNVSVHQPHQYPPSRPAQAQPPPPNYMYQHQQSQQPLQQASSPPPMNFTAPPQQYQSFNFGQPQPQYQQHYGQYQPQLQASSYASPPQISSQPHFQQQQFPNYPGVSQNYVPPPPPPGPPGGGSTTQYSSSTGAPWASGPGGYANYQHRGPNMAMAGPQTDQAQASGAQSSDPWAGLNAWK